MIGGITIVYTDDQVGVFLSRLRWLVDWATLASHNGNVLGMNGITIFGLTVEAGFTCRILDLGLIDN